MKRTVLAAGAVALTAMSLVGLNNGMAWAALVAPQCDIKPGYECIYGPSGAATVHVGNLGGGYMDIYVCDTKADGHNAYDWYNVGTSTHQPTNRQETTAGAGTCTSRIVMPASRITTQVCVDIPNGPDTCSAWLPVNRIG